MQKPRPLTNIGIKNTRPDMKLPTLYDGDGLELRVTPQGSKLWQLRYIHPITRKRRTMCFGSWPAVSLSYARELRDKAKELLVRNIDPLEHKEAERREKRRLTENTFQKIAGDWFKIKSTRSFTEHS